MTQYKLGAKQRRITLGSTKELTLVQARSRAKDVLAKVHLGEDPAGVKSEARARATDTFKAVADRFLLHKEKKLRPASYYSTRLYLMKHLRLLHELRIDKIDRREIASRLSAIAEHHGAVSADRARSALSALFAWCVTQGIADSNPVIGTTKYAEPSSRDRVLSESELAAVWNALPDNDYGSILKLLVLTGCRADEIAWLRWSEIDIDGRKISLPGERTKNKRPFIVPLASTVVDILKDIPRRADRDLVFGKGAGGFQGWSKCKAELDAKLNIPDWTVHDIRRTVRDRAWPRASQHPAARYRGGTEPRVRGTRAGSPASTTRRPIGPRSAIALDRWAHHVAVILAVDAGAVMLEQAAGELTEIPTISDRLCRGMRRTRPKGQRAEHVSEHHCTDHVIASRRFRAEPATSGCKCLRERATSC